MIIEINLAATHKTARDTFQRNSKERGYTLEMSADVMEAAA